MTRASLLSYQQQRFRRVVSYASRHSIYYARIIKDRGIDPRDCRPEDFPVLTKDTLMEHYDDLVTDRRITKASLADFTEQHREPKARYLDRYYVIHTSGTTGLRGYFVYTASELACGVSHSARATPLAPGQKFAFAGKTGGHFPALVIAHTVLLLRPSPIHKDLQCFDENDPISETVEALNAYQPTVLGGYGGFLRKLAHVQLDGTLQIRPRSVQVGGEVLRPGTRTLCEKAFGVPIVNTYACGDLLYIGLDRHDHHGMFLVEDELILELQDNHTLVTSLFQFTQPLIRYRMDDVLDAKLAPQSSLPFRKVRHLVGRVNTPPIFNGSDGQEVAFPVANIEEFHCPRLDYFQFRHTSPTSFEFAVCLEKGLSVSDRVDTLAQIRRSLGELLHKNRLDHVHFDVVQVDHILPDSITGKFKQIVKLF